MILETERLRLRPLRESDLDAYARLLGDPQVMRYIGDGKPLARDEAWRNLALIAGHWALRGYGLWGAEDRATGELVGRIGFFDPEGWPGFEVGWLLARSHQGRGLATEGARVALAFAFLALGRDHVISVIHPGNAASIRVAERIGERFERTAKLAGRAVAIYRIDRSVWQAARPSDAPSAPWLGPERAAAVAGGRVAGAPGVSASAAVAASATGEAGEAGGVVADPSPVAEVNGLDHVYLTVRDLARSIAFYDPIMRALGFRKGTGAIGGEAHVHYFNRALQISLRPARAGAPAHDPYAPGLHHLCLRLDGLDEVDAAVRALTALGVAASAPRLCPEYAPDYYATFFEDPDGLRLELVALRSRRQAVRARWPELVEFENPFDRLSAKR
jgi:RimJ/RimL family protein N-acetyltransferase/catechol 2,3-dioxygenase-like lactoylglutathione lyase family enzyme